MVMVNVQFSDSTKATIVAYFASPQDASAYPNLGTIGTDDPRWDTFYQEVNGLASKLPAPDK